jgi:hypothetical protein
VQGLLSDYSDHGTEFSIKVKEKEQGGMEIFTSDNQLYTTIAMREDSELLYDDQGIAVPNFRNKAANLSGQYQVGRRTAHSTNSSSSL